MTTDVLAKNPDTENDSPLNEKQNVTFQAVPDADDNENSRSPGERLGRARARLNLSAGQVGEVLKIPASYVEAIDLCEFDKLPGLMFTRGYVRSYARLVGLEPDELIDSLDRFTGESSHDTPRLSEGKDIEFRRHITPLMSIGGVISVASFLLIVAFSYYYWGSDDQEVSASTDAASLITPEVLPEESPLSEPVLLEQSELSEPSVEAPDSGQALFEPDFSEGTVASPVEPEVPVTDSEPGIASNAHLVIRFIEDCWVQVKDMQGQLLFADVQKAGSDLDLEVPSAIQVRFGNAPGVQLMTFNGEPVEVKIAAPGRKVASLVLGSEDAG